MSAFVRVARRRAGHPEQGGALILAVGVMVVVGLVVGALLPFLQSAVLGRISLDRLRDREYAADAAIEQSIARVREIPDVGVASCGGPDTPAEVNGTSIRVDCTNQLGITAVGTNLYLQRNVVFVACALPLAADETCDGAAIIRAQVNFEVLAGTGPVSRTYVQSWSVNR